MLVRTPPTQIYASTLSRRQRAWVRSRRRRALGRLYAAVGVAVIVLAAALVLAVLAIFG